MKEGQGPPVALPYKGHEYGYSVHRILHTIPALVPSWYFLEEVGRELQIDKKAQCCGLTVE